MMNEHDEKYERKKIPRMLLCNTKYKDHKHFHKHGYALKQHLYPEVKYIFPTQHFYYEIIGFFRA